MTQDDRDRGPRKITKGWLVYLALTGMNGETRFATIATPVSIADRPLLYQNRNVMPTWLG